MTDVKAKEILKNKFWIIEDANHGKKIGTLSKDENNHYMYCCTSQPRRQRNGSITEYYNCLQDLKQGIGGEILWQAASISDANKTVDKEIYNLSINGTSVDDLSKKFSLSKRTIQRAIKFSKDYKTRAKKTEKPLLPLNMLPNITFIMRI